MSVKVILPVRDRKVSVWLQIFSNPLKSELHLILELFPILFEPIENESWDWVGLAKGEDHFSEIFFIIVDKRINFMKIYGMPQRSRNHKPIILG